MTGPTYPLKGNIMFNGKDIPFKFKRSHAGPTDCPITVTTNDESIHGVVEWKRYNVDDPWTQVDMIFKEGILSAELPNQPHAGKLEYRVVLSAGNAIVNIPSEGSVAVRFRGDVPWYVLIPHIIAMFGGMLLSARAGLEALRKTPNLQGLILATVVFLFAGGLILGPLVQWYAFDAFWTGWPIGHDLTDNKTAAALIVWLVALFMLKRSKVPYRWALTAAIVTLLVYLIPHSVLGSEIDYNQLNRKNVSNAAVAH
jgi:hypothetical protein